MTAFESLAVEVRLLMLFIVGVLVGTQVNRGIYRLAWFPRAIGPWSAPHPNVPPRRWYDRVPIIGWYFLRREMAVHGPAYWIRPLLMEISVGLVFAGVYWYEVVRHGVAGFDPGHGVLLIQCATHLLLITLMLVATFIDFDEQTIPDAITLPGTLLGLTIAALFPMSRALVAIPAPTGYAADFIHIGSGIALPAFSGWHDWLDGPYGLLLGLVCFVAWCVAIMPWTWTTRRGLVKAVQFFLASLERRPATRPLSMLAVLGCLPIAVVWTMGGERWEGLLSALVGMAVGGGAIWAVRIVGSAALGQEAMGFGDVTLMAMVGTFTGWQPTLIIFFLAPFSAVFIAVAQYVLTRRHDIAFGPYLCLATVLWLLNSHQLWREYGLPIYSMGWFVPIVGGSGLVLMGGLLWLWRMIREALFFPSEMGDEHEKRQAQWLQSNHAPSQVEAERGLESGLVSVWESGKRPAHPLRLTQPLQRQALPIPPLLPRSHRPLPPHARGAR